jgi:SAM-dependent methyltransferase
MKRFFQREGDGRGAGSGAAATLRSSRGWGDTLVFLREREGMRVLDFGATSSANINFLTQLGHSVYMANVVEDAAKGDWMRPVADDPKGKTEFDGERFAKENFDFSGKEFDAVLLWDTANYLPPGAVPLLFRRLHDVLRPGGRLLAFFHGRSSGPETVFSRYNITDGPELRLHAAGAFPVQQVYQTRQIEKFLEGYSDVRFFLGKDNVREVIATR